MIFVEARPVVFLAHVLNPDVNNVIAIAKLVIQVFNRKKKREKQHKSSNSQLFPQLVVIQKSYRSNPEVIRNPYRNHAEIIPKHLIPKSSRRHPEDIQIPFQSIPSHKSCQSIHIFSSTIRLSNQPCWLHFFWIGNGICTDNKNNPERW